MSEVIIVGCDLADGPDRSGLTVAKLIRVQEILDANRIPPTYRCEFTEFMGFKFLSPPTRSPESKALLMRRLENERKARPI